MLFTALKQGEKFLLIIAAFVCIYLIINYIEPWLRWQIKKRKMLQIDDKIVSLDIFDHHFICDLSKCLGSCCVNGDSGAPLEKEEVKILENILDDIKPYLTPQGLDVIEKTGVSVIDRDGDLVTPLVGGNDECAFAIFNEAGVCLCGIEAAYRDKKIDYVKPASCHLYPIRIKKFADYTALNYDVWYICAPAREKGEKEGVPVYQFLKEPLIKVFGEYFYEQLDDAYKHYRPDFVD